MALTHSEHSESHPAEVVGSAPPRQGNRRSRTIVNWRYQLRGSVLPVAGTVILLCLLNVAIHFVAAAGGGAVTQVVPEAGARVQAENATSQAAMLLASLVFVIVVCIVALRATHRTAGPVYRIKMQLQQLASGDLSTRVQLRQHDNLQDLAQVFNVTARALQERAEAERQTLQTLARVAERLDPESEGKKLALELRRLADTKVNATVDRPESPGLGTQTVQVPAGSTKASPTNSGTRV